MYELYKGPIYDPHRRYPFPTVTITSLGDIQFNKYLVEELKSSNFCTVQCYYNSITDRIGFRFHSYKYITGSHTVFAGKHVYMLLKRNVF